MKTKYFSLLFLSCCMLNAALSQGILNKIKDKTSGKENSKTTESNKPKIAWCDTAVLANSGAANNANPNYNLAYSSPAGFTIMYDESRLAIGRNKNDYHLILKQTVDKKQQFVIIDNGKVTSTVTELTNANLVGGLRSPLDGLNTGGGKSDNEKYIIAETTTVAVPGVTAKTVTAPKNIDVSKTNQAFEMMKNTDEYKKMSPEEKKQLEEAMKMMPQAAKEYNNSGMAGQTITTPEVKGGTYSGANGFYSIIVKGKNYGRFGGQPYLKVSDDEANVYIVADDGKGKTNFIANDKKTLLNPKNNFGMGHIGNLIMSPDGKKAAFVENKLMTEKEQQDMLKDMQAGKPAKQNFIVTKTDGSSFQITRTDGGDKFKISNSGAVVFVDAKTGEVFADGKIIGKFNTGIYGDLNSDALLFGSDPSKICYYNEDGSLSFMDGAKKDMGILFPTVIAEGGKSYITWFRKCKNDIYIGKFEF
jgi:hypothetical protein